MSLHDAVLANDVASLDALIVRGVHVNSVNERRWTPLLLAGLQGHVECVKVLLEAHADVDKAQVNGKAPLHWATQYGNVECVRVCGGDGVCCTHA